MKQKILKMEVLVVVGKDFEDFEDSDHEFDDALRVVEGVVGVASTRLISETVYDELDELPLYDDGMIWNEVK